VHHGLSAHADAWLAEAEALCRRWARRGLPVALAARLLAERPGRGDSVEAWARRARYRALREMALERGVDLVLLGHHRRDQAETFVLQALRSGGVAALSAMPRLVRRDGITWARPWLELPREAIEAYARRHRLRWIDDDSNADGRFARNRLRLRVWPALSAAFEDAEASLAAAAERAQQAAAVVDEIAALDVAAVADADGVDLAAWRRLSSARQRQALLRWLRGALPEAPSASLVERLMREADAAGPQRRWPVSGGGLLSYRGRLRAAPNPATPFAAPTPITVDLSRSGVHEVAAWRGAFRIDAVDAHGISVATAQRLELRPRAPGDQFQAGVRRPPRSLKLQFQARGVAPALRDGPIAWCDGRIVFVPGLGIDARALAATDEAQVSLTWLPAEAPRARRNEGAR
jgi:tRNA(Ile)-lysidine synthase